MHNASVHINVYESLHEALHRTSVKLYAVLINILRMCHDLVSKSRDNC